MSSPDISLAAEPIDGATSPPPFSNILFNHERTRSHIDSLAEPDCFGDLNLDQVVADVTAGRGFYRLTGFFYAPLTTVDAVHYRQEVFQDLERPELHKVVSAFAAAMVSMREALERMTKSHYLYQRERWFLEAAEQYCAGVAALASDLAGVGPGSRGLRGLIDYLAGYVRSLRYIRLRDEAARVRRGLDAVRYNLVIRGNRITVGHCHDEPDYSREVAETFERFRQGTVKNHRMGGPSAGDMGHVEAGVLGLVAKLFPVQFAALDAFCQENSDYQDPTMGVFDREIQFYLAFLAYVAPLRGAGLGITYPRMSAVSKQEHAGDTFDLALASKLVREGRVVVSNGFYLNNPERILVVTGPNNGGKTTLARTFGQLHYLAKLGCPVPGRDVRLFFCDAIFTHFEKEEDIATLAGKLQDELNRLRADLDHATPNSVVVMNEMFSSTALQDALFLSQEILTRLTRLDALCVCVTFLDELASLNEKTVSMVSTVVADDPATRTYKLVRKPADGRAFARALADRYRLTYEALRERLGR